MKIKLIFLFFILMSFNIHAQDKNEINCEFESFDYKQDKNIVALQKQDLFMFTPDYLESTLTNYSLVEGKGGCYQTSGYVYFELELVVNSKIALKDYGQIAKGNLLKFFLLDGSEFYSQNVTYKRPKFKNNKQSAIYLAVCVLSKDELKQLKNSYLDKIGVVWSQGYEEYDVYNPDFFMDQLYCLENH